LREAPDRLPDHLVFGIEFEVYRVSAGLTRPRSYDFALPTLGDGSGTGSLFREARSPASLIAHRAEDVPTFPQELYRGVPLPRHIVDDVRIPAREVHARHPGPALLVREVVQTRSREGAAVQHHEDRPEVHVRLGEPVVLQLREVPLDQLPLRRALDEEREVEAQPVPDRDEV